MYALFFALERSRNRAGESGEQKGISGSNWTGTCICTASALLIANTGGMARRCPFCDNPADSAEHVDPLWITRMYLEADSSPGTFTVSFGDLYPDRTAKTLNQTVRVCSSCNSGWMAQLEAKAKPALVALRSGEPLRIGPQGQEVLASWLMKSAIVREFVMPASSPFRVSTMEQRSLVRAGKIPEGWQVAIGAYEGTGPQLTYRFSTVKRYVSNDGVAGGSVVLHTTRFECFVGQVLLHSMVERPVLRDLLGGSGYSIVIPQTTPVEWPPSAVFTADSLEIVCDFGAKAT